MFSLKMQHLPDSILKVMIHRKWGVKTKTFFKQIHVFLSDALWHSKDKEHNRTI